MTPVSATRPPTLSKQYPHVDDVGDWRAQQSLRLLWDRIFALEARLQASESTVGDLVNDHNALEDQVAKVKRTADDAFATAQLTAAEQAHVGEEELPGGGDGGAGNAGCAAAGADGHDGGGTLDPERAGRIVCGTGNEFPSLLVATVDLPTREANAEELLLRMIWHLRQAGFNAGRQQNPSGAISKDKLTVYVDGVLRVYDVFVGKGDYLTDMTTAMNETSPPVFVDDPGTAD